MAKIEVVGSGCPKCKALFELTKEVVLGLGIKGDVEYSNDISKIVAMGVMSSPVLAIDGKAVLVGVLPDKEKLTQVISEKVLNSSDGDKKGCSCNCGNC